MEGPDLKVSDFLIIWQKLPLKQSVSRNWDILQWGIFDKTDTDTRQLGIKRGIQNSCPFTWMRFHFSQPVKPLNCCIFFYFHLLHCIPVTVSAPWWLEALSFWVFISTSSFCIKEASIMHLIPCSSVIHLDLLCLPKLQLFSPVEKNQIFQLLQLVCSCRPPKCWIVGVSS